MRCYYQFSLVLGSQIHQNRVLEASGICLERLGSVLERLGRVLGHLAASWSRLGAVLERPGAVLESSWSRLEASGGCLPRSEPFRPANSAPRRAAREGVEGREGQSTTGRASLQPDGPVYNRLESTTVSLQPDGPVYNRFAQ